MKSIQKRFTPGQFLGALAALFLGLVAVAYAVTLPNTFTAGTTISASQVNANFSALNNALPGIARNGDSSQITVANAGNTNIINATITVPAAGYIVARAMALGQVTGSPIGNILMSISTATGVFGGVPNYALFGASDEVSSAVRWGDMVTERTFSVAAGTYTYYVVAQRGFIGGTALLWYPKFVLTYYPGASGTVTVTSESAASPQATPVGVP